MKKTTKKAKKPAKLRIFGLYYCRPGLTVGMLFFALSLLPSMLPRHFIFQGLVSAVSLVIGYGLGVLGHKIWRYLQIPEFKNKTQDYVKKGLVGLVIFLVLYCTFLAVGWQNQVRDVFGQESIGFSYIVFVYFVTVILALLFLIIGRSIRTFYFFLSHQLDRFLPRRVAMVLGLFLLFFILNFAYTGLLAKGFFAISNSVFSTANNLNMDEYEKPSSSLRSGSEQSDISWESLGREGRKFVVSGPNSQDITDFSGTTAKEPIRVFAGLESAEDFESRSDLVLKELIRTKAFDRKVLLITTSTGSGWLDPKAMDPFEYINNGDTAIAGMQYSYLPSWISLLADQENVRASSEALFSKIYGYWSTLPADSRPKIYLYGLSLGSFGVERVLNSVELVNVPIDGAVLAGPPFVNPLHNRLEEERSLDSPAWLPIVNDGTTVRFTEKYNKLDEPTGKWGSTKIVYLQHATDPIVWFSGDLLLNKPAWLEDGQRGPGITENFVWIPIVTMSQMAADLSVAGGVNNGYGHNYAVSSNIDIWSELINPEGWNDAKSDKLNELLKDL